MTDEMRFETPAELFRRLKLGREEFCQRLLTTLILGAPYPRWNTRSRTSPQGTAFLRDLWDLSFVTPWPGDDFWFVDEFELPGRTPAEKGAAPDYALLWPDRVWVIELKTERTSHRPAQIPTYFELARHHHPTCNIDLTYLTGPGSKSGLSTQPWERFAHLEWESLLDLIDRHWPDPVVPGQAEVVRGLSDTIRGLDQPAGTWRASAVELYGEVPAAPVVDPFEEAMRLAALTAGDGEHRALDVQFGSLDLLHDMRIRVRDELASLADGDPRRYVRPWVWRWETKDDPMTAAGVETGFELHFSRYDKDLYEGGPPRTRSNPTSGRTRTAPTHATCPSCHVLKPRAQLTETGCVDCD